MSLILALLVAFVAGLIVYFVGSFFDRTVDNRYAAVGGLIVFLLVFLSQYGRIDL